MEKPRNVFLIGPMGAGKTTVGKILADELGLDFLDTDKEIEERTGADIGWIFDVEGEEGVACDVTYLPQFGPVAGYREGATFEYIDHRGDKQKRNVIVRVRKETLRWGEPAEWRVAGVDYGGPPEFL